MTEHPVGLRLSLADAFLPCTSRHRTLERFPDGTTVARARMAGLQYAEQHDMAVALIASGDGWCLLVEEYCPPSDVIIMPLAVKRTCLSCGHDGWKAVRGPHAAGLRAIECLECGHKWQGRVTRAEVATSQTWER